MRLRIRRHPIWQVSRERGREVTPQTRDTLPWFGQVRPAIWLLLIGTLGVALALPVFSLWNAASSPLTAEVCLRPPPSQARETAQMVVSLPDAADRDAVAGSWAHLRVAWGMETMPMGIRPLTLSGDASHAGMFSIPLRVDMAGPWWVDLTLQTPGRPVWHAHFQLTVAPPGGAAPTLLVQPGQGAPAPCGPNERPVSL